MAFDNLPPDPEEKESGERVPVWHRPVNAEQTGRLPEGFNVAPAIRPADLEETVALASGDATAAPAQVEAEAAAPPRVAPGGTWNGFWSRKAPALAAAALVLAGVVAGGGVTYGVMSGRTTTPPFVSVPRRTAPAGSSVSYSPAGDVTQIYNAVAPSVVRITETSRVSSFGFLGPQNQTETGIGTGIVLDTQGHILTNNHVISGSNKIQVEFFGGKKVEGTVVGSDSSYDLAIVKVDPTGLNLHPAALGDSDAVQVGQPAVAIGNPFGDYGWSISSGIISGKNRPLQDSSGHSMQGLLQTDAAINPGNSGGPLVDMNGNVIGINTAIQSPVRGSVGIGFAIPVNLARTVLTTLIKGEQVQHPWLGVGLRALTSDLQSQLNINVDHGLILPTVVSGSPAAKAGLQKTYQQNDGTVVLGDIITGIDNVQANVETDLINYVGSKHVGDKVTLHILRQGKALDVAITLGAKPQQLSNQ